MKLKMLAKDESSGKAGSPAVYLGENRKLVIQGHTLDPDTRANLVNFVAGEDAVEIDLDIVRAALAALM